MSRYLSQLLSEYAEEKFVLVSGPRQVGKTTIGRDWLGDFDGRYLSWDDPADREQILRRAFLDSVGLEAVMLDEFHRYARWKSWLKGVYDKYWDSLRLIVTGSARLDTFQKSGDSLLGRTETLRLHPFTVGEIAHGTMTSPPQDASAWLRLGFDKKKSALKSAHAHWDELIRFGGFPEPLFRQNVRQHTRWLRMRRTLLLQEDLREIESFKLVSMIEHLALLLPDRVGSTLSLNALRQELSVSHESITRWLVALERLFYIYRIRPFHQRLARSLKKDRKLYLWDWSELGVGNPSEKDNRGARLENMVASHLLKACQLWTDRGDGEYELMYWRDQGGREVDFIITEMREPVVAIEVHTSKETLSKSLSYFGRTYQKIPLIQLVDKRNVDKIGEREAIRDVRTFVTGLS